MLCKPAHDKLLLFCINYGRAYVACLPFVVDAGVWWHTGDGNQAPFTESAEKSFNLLESCLTRQLEGALPTKLTPKGLIAAYVMGHPAARAAWTSTSLGADLILHAILEIPVPYPDANAGNETTKRKAVARMARILTCSAQYTSKCARNQAMSLKQLTSQDSGASVSDLCTGMLAQLVTEEWVTLVDWVWCGPCPEVQEGLLLIVPAVILANRPDILPGSLLQTLKAALVDILGAPSYQLCAWRVLESVVVDVVQARMVERLAQRGHVTNTLLDFQVRKQTWKLLVADAVRSLSKQRGYALGLLQHEKVTAGNILNLASALGRPHGRCGGWLCPGTLLILRLVSRAQLAQHFSGRCCWAHAG